MSLRRIIGLSTVAAGLVFGSAAVAASPAMAATTHSAHTTGVATPKTDPPGSCNSDENGTWKYDDSTQEIYECEYVSGEGYYWIPVY
jgi:hypothetical protein